MFVVNKNPTPADLRKFGWAMLVGFGIIALILWAGPWLGAWWRSQPAPSLAWLGSTRQWFAVAVAVLALLLWAVSLFAPAIAKPVYIAWMTATVPIGVVMSTILLTLLFVFLLPPFALIVRLSDPLRRKLTKQGTYWEPYKPHEPTLERMRRPF